MIPLNFDPGCVAPGQVVLFRIPAERRPTTFTVIDAAGRARLETCLLPAAMFFTQLLLLADGEVWVRASDATTAHVATGGIGSDDPDRGWVRSLAAQLEVAG